MSKMVSFAEFKLNWPGAGLGKDEQIELMPIFVDKLFIMTPLGYTIYTDNRYMNKIRHGKTTDY